MIKIKILFFLLISLNSFSQTARDYYKIGADNYNRLTGEGEKIPDGKIHEVYKKALMGYSKAIELTPNYSLPYYSRAVLLNNFGGEDNDFYSCISDLTRAIELKPEARYYSLRALCKGSLKDFNSAVEDLSKAIKLDPSNFNHWLGRGSYKIKIGDFYGSISDCSIAIEISDLEYQKATALMNRALAKHGLKDNKGACDDLNKSLDLGYDRTPEEVKNLIKICN